MDNGSPSRRSWADEADEKLPSLRSLGAGSPGLLSDVAALIGSPSASFQGNACHSQTRSPLHRRLREGARPLRVLPVAVGARVVAPGWSMGSWRRPCAHTLRPPRWPSLRLPRHVIALLRLCTPLAPSRCRIRTCSMRFAADTGGAVAHL